MNSQYPEHVLSGLETKQSIQKMNVTAIKYDHQRVMVFSRCSTCLVFARRNVDRYSLVQFWIIIVYLAFLSDKIKKKINK